MPELSVPDAEVITELIGVLAEALLLLLITREPAGTDMALPEEMPPVEGVAREPVMGSAPNEPVPVEPKPAVPPLGKAGLPAGELAEEFGRVFTLLLAVGFAGSDKIFPAGDEESEPPVEVAPAADGPELAPIPLLLAPADPAEPAPAEPDPPACARA